MAFDPPLSTFSAPHGGKEDHRFVLSSLLSQMESSEKGKHRAEGREEKITQREEMEVRFANPWNAPSAMASARQVPTGPDPIHHRGAPPSHHSL
ncbi:hypothetical protein HPP92_022494 [Vanilla planifolia]|uniref:Uncharacterized protein n=1 Tax=Vanilla planifolia TaxID=51239 RepID=A0A835PSA3_VANPL|nr:hypothetical protein HPP92_022785 [Vanilla planifolia]KAG0459366.1 hypothetical protein HPP92_022494 [Vanilla planifolia]